MDKPNKKPETLEELSTARNKKLREAAREEIHELYNDLVVNIPRTIMPEAVFIEYFLDLFMKGDNGGNELLMYKWVELAGGPYNEVNIVDQKGNVIYSTPGAMLQLNIPAETLQKYSFVDIAAMYAMKQRITSAQATNYLNGALASIPKEVIGDVKIYIQRWSEIFKRYQPPVADKNNAAAKPAGPDVGILDL